MGKKIILNIGEEGISVLMEKSIESIDLMNGCRALLQTLAGKDGEDYLMVLGALVSMGEL